jgi:hypothetical protein
MLIVSCFVASRRVQDSLALLHCLLETQKRSPVKFELACATVNPGIEVRPVSNAFSVLLWLYIHGRDWSVDFMCTSMPSCILLLYRVQQSFNPRPLIKYMEKLGVPYYFLDSTIFEVYLLLLASYEALWLLSLTRLAMDTRQLLRFFCPFVYTGSRGEM